MLPPVAELVRKPRESNAEREIARALRQVSEDARFAFLCDWFQPDHRRGRGYMAGFNLLRSVTLKPPHLAYLLRYAIEHADASDARSWLETLGPKIGPKGLATILAEAAAENPKKVNNWVYWLDRSPWRTEHPEELQAIRDALAPR